MYPDAYIQYLVHFHADRDYFECHELLEEHWKKEPPSKRLPFWVALIQIAVAQYHYRRNNQRGAIRLLSHARTILENDRKTMIQYGLQDEALLVLLQENIRQMEEGKAYTSITLPIADSLLESILIQECTKLGLEWNSKSDLSNLFLINKHLLRNRTEVIEERNKQIKKRKQGL